MASLLEELRTVIDALESARLGYALCGGLALAIHGVPRATQDIDLLIREEDWPAVRQVAVALGFDLESRPMSFGHGEVEIRGLSKLLPPARSVPGAGTPTPGLASVTPAMEAAWASRIRIQWRYGRLTVVSRAGLIQLKRLSGRRQDLADIERLLECGE